MSYAFHAVHPLVVRPGYLNVPAIVGNPISVERDLTSSPEPEYLKNQINPEPPMHPPGAGMD